MFLHKNFVFISIFIFLLGVPIVGQEFSIDDAGSEESESFDIEVTADKRTERMQDVPTSITAIDAQEIKDGGIDETQDVGDYVPNMHIYRSGVTTSFYSLRGQNNMNFLSNPIGIYVDDVPVLQTFASTDSFLWNIEQIEVLRGPQGNLYGLNSSAGVVNVKTRKPENYWTSGVHVSYGNYNTLGVQGNVSGPLVKDKLYFGLSGNYRRADSFVKEEGSDRSSWIGAGRGQVRYIPFDRLELDLSAQTAHFDADYTTWTLADDDPYKVDEAAFDNYSKSTVHSQSLRGQYTLDGVDIVSVTGLNNGEMEAQANKFYTTRYNGYAVDATSFMEELRLVSNNRKDPFQWLIGGFYMNGKQESESWAELTTYDIQTNTDGSLEEQSYAAFGQASYTLFDRFSITPGLRYDYNNKKVSQAYTSSTSTETSTLNDEDSWSSLSPRLSLDYKITNDALIYGSVAKGYKAGGYVFYAYLSDDVDNIKYNPEENVTYELGTKTSWFGNKLKTNLALFASSIKDMQLYYYDTDASQGMYTNVGKTSIYGAEAEIGFRPIRQLELTMPVGWMKSTIEEHKTEDYEGNTVPLVPEYTLGFVAQYDHTLGFFMRGEANLLGKTYFDEANTQSQESYWVFNAKAGYKKENISLSGYVKNILNEEYYTYRVTASGLDSDLATVGAPRTFGAEASLEF
jgi:iron complex outermembrane receptor protein